MILKSLNFWSVPGGLAGTLDPVEFMRIAKNHGFPGVELSVGDTGSAFPVDATEDFCRDLVRMAEEIGVKIGSVASGLYWSRNLGDKDVSTRAQAADDLKRMIRITSLVGARTLLTIPGAVDVFFLPDREPLPYKHVWDHASEGLRSVLPLAEELDVRLGIENVWNKFLISPQEMALFIDQFDSPCVGAYVDVANLLPFGHAEDWLRYLGHRVVGIHFKDFRRAVGTAEGFVDLLEGDVNWPEVMAVIRAIGYEGAIPAEMIPLYKHSPLVRVANASRAMDAILAM